MAVTQRELLVRAWDQGGNTPSTELILSGAGGQAHRWHSSWHCVVSGSRGPSELEPWGFSWSHLGVGAERPLFSALKGETLGMDQSGTGQGAKASGPTVSGRAWGTRGHCWGGTDSVTRRVESGRPGMSLPLAEAVLLDD